MDRCMYQNDACYDCPIKEECEEKNDVLGLHGQGVG
jgi:hypothetical protein